MKIQSVLPLAGLSLVITSLAACSPQEVSSPLQSASQPQTVSAPALVTCNACGVVESVTAVTQEGDTTGTGAVLGAVVGGVAGNQVGGGSGKKIATVAGVVGGALLGNNIEKNRNISTGYDIVINMEKGGQQFITVQDPGALKPGSAVNVIGSEISLR